MDSKSELATSSTSSGSTPSVTVETVPVNETVPFDETSYSEAAPQTNTATEPAVKKETQTNETTEKSTTEKNTTEKPKENKKETTKKETPAGFSFMSGILQLTEEQQKLFNDLHIAMSGCSCANCGKSLLTTKEYLEFFDAKSTTYDNFLNLLNIEGVADQTLVDKFLSLNDSKKWNELHRAVIVYELYRRNKFAVVMSLYEKSSKLLELLPYANQIVERAFQDLLANRPEKIVLPAMQPLRVMSDCIGGLFTLDVIRLYSAFGTAEQFEYVAKHAINPKESEFHVSDANVACNAGNADVVKYLWTKHGIKPTVDVLKNVVFTITFDDPSMRPRMYQTASLMAELGIWTPSLEEVKAIPQLALQRLVATHCLPKGFLLKSKVTASQAAYPGKTTFPTPSPTATATVAPPAPQAPVSEVAIDKSI